MPMRYRLLSPSSDAPVAVAINNEGRGEDGTSNATPTATGRAALSAAAPPPAVRARHHPSVLSLRIPAGLLSDLASPSSSSGAKLSLMVAGEGADAGGGGSPPVAAVVTRPIGGGGELEREELPVRSDDLGGVVADVYCAAASKSPSVPADRTTGDAAATIDGGNGSGGGGGPPLLRCVGSATARYTVAAASRARDDDDIVRELGRKARRRLEEERSKRKEIVRIEDMPPVGGAGRSGRRGGASSSPTIPAPKRKRKRRRPRDAISKSASAAGESPAGPPIDAWSPDTSQVRRRGGNKPSNLVRAHGLPVGTKPENVRSFFAGLGPERVFVLPSCRVSFDAWDCHDRNRKDRGGGDAKPWVERYQSTLRVFVQFASAAAAEMALERSGEAVYITTVGATDTQLAEAGQGKVGAAVSLTFVPKFEASFLRQSMAIDGVKGQPLHETSGEVDEQLSPVTKRALWVMARKNLGLELTPAAAADAFADSDTGSEASDAYTAFIELGEGAGARIPTDASSYRHLATVYNKVCDLQECMGLDSYLVLSGHDPTLVDDSVCRLTSAASDWILDELERIELILRHARSELSIRESEGAPRGLHCQDVLC